MSVPETQNGTGSGDDLLWKHLKTVPAFRALLRAVEARFYHHLDIPDPILDLGCGDGHFAEMAFERPLTAGVDPWWGPLRKAHRTGVYRMNIQALGDALPFADNTFASVISNSVLEHIPDVQPVLNEAARVLKPNGALVITTPSHLFTEYLGGAALLRPLGLADAYRRVFNRISRHAHTDPPEIWASRLTQAGVIVERWQYYFSKDALRVLEMGHVQGLPSALLHFLTGHWILAPWRENLQRTERWVRPFYEEAAPGEGAYLLIVGRKTGEGRQTADKFDVRLPAPRPLPHDEPLPETEVKLSHAPKTVPSERDATVYTFSAADTARPGSESETRSTGIMRNLPALLLLLAGLLASFTGQSILNRRLPSSLSGLAWYGVAIVAFAAGALSLQQQKLQRATPAFSRRILLFPLAIVLATLSQEQSGATLSGGNALLAFALWLTAISVAYLALMPGAKVGPALVTATPDAPGTDNGKSSGVAALVLPYQGALVVVALFFGALLPRLFALDSHPFILNGIEASVGLDAVAVLRGQIRNPFATAWLTNPTLPLFPLAVPVALFGRTVLGVRILSGLVGALTVPVLYAIARRLWHVHFALIAALLLAGYHLHVHYSRLGMTNIWDPLMTLLIVGLISLAVEDRRRAAWLLAGMVTGLGAAFYTTSHLLPFILGAMLIYFVFVRRDILFEQWPHMLAFVGFALVVALPQILFYRANPGLFTERANTLGILQNGWLAQQSAAGNTVLDALLEQMQRAFLAFNASLDTSTSYNPGIPLLRFWPSVFFVLGVAVAVWRLRQPRYAFLVIWLVATLLFGGALLVDAPDSHRLLIAAPAVIMLATTGLCWLARRFNMALENTGDGRPMPDNHRARRARTLGIALLLLLFIGGDLFFYFGQYRLSHRFGDRNSEVAHVMGHYLSSLEGEWQVQFHGAPAMYVSFPTILFLADTFEPGQNLFDVTDTADALPGGSDDMNLAFIFLPERSGEVNQVAEQHPQGALRTFDGVLANPLFYVYEVRP